MYDLATKIYTQSGHKIELAIIRDIVNYRTEDLSYKLVAEQKRIKQKWAEEEARHRIEEEKKAKEAYCIEQERIAEETRLHANQKHQIERSQRIVDKEDLAGKFKGDQCKANFFVRVREITSEQLGVEESEIKLESTFRNDLGADDLDSVELILAFEEIFEIEVPDEDADSIRTVEEAVDYFQEKQTVKYFSLIHNLFYKQ